MNPFISLSHTARLTNPVRDAQQAFRAILEALARGDEGFLLSMGYSTQRGYGNNHPFVGEVRGVEVEVEFEVEFAVEFYAPEPGHAMPIGRSESTECQMASQFMGSADEAPQFTGGYGLVLGRAERRARPMSLVDRSRCHEESSERIVSPAQDGEFAIAHSDNVEAAGFVEHPRLSHYVDFQAELGLIRKLRQDFRARKSSRKPQESAAPALCILTLPEVDADGPKELDQLGVDPPLDAHLCGADLLVQPAEHVGVVGWKL